MSAPTKRRHLFYYLSLPFVVAIVFFMVAKLAALQRAEIVADLADRVAHHDAPQAAAALRQLAAMPRPPIDILVEAAASADAGIAHEAQLQISGVLRKWQRKIEASQGVVGVARQLAELSRALDDKHTTFSPSDHRWLTNTTHKILRLANRIPPPNSPLVAAHCDAVLATIGTREASLAALVNRDLENSGPPAITTAVAPAELLQDGQSYGPTSTPEPQRRFAPRPVSPFTTAVEPAERDDDESGIGEGIENQPAIKPSTLPVEENRSKYNPTWQYPGLNATPAMPIESTPQHRAETSGARSAEARFAKDEIAKSTTRPLADADSRELLKRWLAATDGDVYPIESELTQRGFGRLSAALVEPLFAAEAVVRLRLVDDVLTQPGIDARPWLMLLADDTDADVRLLAVTIMATSDDSLLIEKAWLVAIHDRDPRIAGLASRLRERRTNTQRR